VSAYEPGRACVRQVHAVGVGNAVPFQCSARGDLYDVKLAGTPAGMRCPRIEGMGVSLCPQRVEGHGHSFWLAGAGT
jgi:hypothetical protein